mmetsp:Transcript_12380/g.19269  ORF Transcript_12380/g.19269 Transcript_12380/m.19269 type:complete len:204 (-) Transcript_12380:1091-1702(-)
MLALLNLASSSKMVVFDLLPFFSIPFTLVPLREMPFFRACFYSSETSVSMFLRVWRFDPRASLVFGAPRRSTATKFPVVSFSNSWMLNMFCRKLFCWCFFIFLLRSRFDFELTDRDPSFELCSTASFESLSDRLSELPESMLWLSSVSLSSHFSRACLFLTIQGWSYISSKESLCSGSLWSIISIMSMSPSEVFLRSTFMLLR